tara:strand:- start:727 stop:1062 length:336 start_codon:yes stop_codon:yes gene_type:complete
MKLNYTTKWIFQKISAIIFLLALVYNIYSIHDLEFKNYIEISAWFKNYLNSISILILFFSIFFHSNIGISSIIDDYFHDEILKKKILVLKNFFFVILFFITIFSIARLTIK